MILPTIQIPISLDIFDFHLIGFTKDYQQYIFDEKIAVITEKKKNVWARYEILFREECNTVNNSPGVIFGQIESIVINDNSIEMRAAVFRMEEVPIASDFFSKFYEMVQNKWDVEPCNFHKVDESNEYLYLKEVNPEVDTGWNGERDAVVYAYRKLVQHSGIDSKYLPYFPCEMVVNPGDLDLENSIKDPDHQHQDDLDFYNVKYFDFKDELNRGLFQITESYNTAFPNQTKRGKKGPADRIKKLAECVRRLQETNKNLTWCKAAIDATHILYYDIWSEIWDKDPSLQKNNKINGIADKKFLEVYKTKKFLPDNVRYAYKVMGYDWKPAKKGK